ncbi:hypothetical protein [Blastopirellula marina]|uniref:Uncharacterized protein n=1 Tax=Blastopirellula marina DSM 3645 TaxID=314230 RepID=A3ZS82_9BACT|nr:hypothetical protein [Blastopirellula marina]EAQ80540.1 hypothetical protein DSM3645_14380 [Blastopirellula marina DSM 3645]
MNARSKFYTEEDLTMWERVKRSFANDWEQTKADFGVEGNRDMNQDLDDTVKQMAGSDNAFENREQAFRFGYTAQRRYQESNPEWNDDLEQRLRADYDGDYDADRQYIQHAYGFRYPT